MGLEIGIKNRIREGEYFDLDQLIKKWKSIKLLTSESKNINFEGAVDADLGVLDLNPNRGPLSKVVLRRLLVSQLLPTRLVLKFTNIPIQIRISTLKPIGSLFRGTSTCLIPPTLNNIQLREMLSMSEKEEGDVVVMEHKSSVREAFLAVNFSGGLTELEASKLPFTISDISSHVRDFNDVMIGKMYCSSWESRSFNPSRDLCNVIKDEELNEASGESNFYLTGRLPLRALDLYVEVEVAKSECQETFQNAKYLAG